MSGAPPVCSKWASEGLRFWYALLVVCQARDSPLLARRLTSSTPGTRLTGGGPAAVQHDLPPDRHHGRGLAEVRRQFGHVRVPVSVLNETGVPSISEAPDGRNAQSVQGPRGIRTLCQPHRAPETFRIGQGARELKNVVDLGSTSGSGLLRLQATTARAACRIRLRRVSERLGILSSPFAPSLLIG